MENNTIKIVVWDDIFCDVPFEIIDSNGFSLQTLNDINEQFIESNYDWKDFYDSEIIIKVTHVPAQVGNYPPPNIEVQEYWDWEVIEKSELDYRDNYEKDENLEFLF